LYWVHAHDGELLTHLEDLGHQCRLSGRARHRSRVDLRSAQQAKASISCPGVHFSAVTFTVTFIGKQAKPTHKAAAGCLMRDGHTWPKTTLQCAPVGPVGPACTTGKIPARKCQHKVDQHMGMMEAEEASISWFHCTGTADQVHVLCAGNQPYYWVAAQHHSSRR
jgi:hypothetical protein